MMRILHVESALEAIVIMRPSIETAHKALYPVHLSVCLSVFVPTIHSKSENRRNVKFGGDVTHGHE